MIVIKDKNNNTKKGYISATDVQLLDIEDKFKHKNLEDALKEVGSGTEENMIKIEGKVNQLDKDKSNILNKFNEYGKKDGTLQTGLNAEMLGSKKAKDFVNFNVAYNNCDANTFLSAGMYEIACNGSILTNFPDGNSGGVLFVSPGSHERWMTQQYNSQSGKMFYRNSNDKDGVSRGWQLWKEISQNESSKVTLLNGWSNWSDSTHDNIFYKNGYLGFISLTVKKLTSNDTTVIAKTPYPPSKRIISFACNGGSKVLEARLEPNGEIRLNSTGYSAGSWVAINMCYPIYF